MVVYIYGDRDTPAYKEAKRVIDEVGCIILNKPNFKPDLAIAPLLTRILSPGEIDAPEIGTLIFHPSPLPYGRGASSLRYAYRRKEPVSGSTWFWANHGKVDSGDICEQEIIKIDYGKSPREFYEQDIIPSMARTLKRALLSIEDGNIRRVPQIEQYASFDLKI